MSKAVDYRPGKTPIRRRNYSKIASILDIPNLLEVQTKSYEKFLQRTISPAKRKEMGLQEVFVRTFPINDYKGLATLEFKGYEQGIWECKCGEYIDLGGPGVVCDRCHKELSYKEKFHVDDCRQRGLTYADPLKILVRLVVKEEIEGTGEFHVREVKEQKIYLGEIPLMTETGTFIINGTERVAVSQMHRSPGAFFTSEKGKGAQSGQTNYSARLIPYRGSWLDFEFDVKDILYVRIDRRRKFPVSVLLKALGYEIEELISHFYNVATINFDHGQDEFAVEVTPDILGLGLKVHGEIKSPKTGESLVRSGRKLSKKNIRTLIEHDVKTLRITREEILGQFCAQDVVDEETGEILVEINSSITEETLNVLRERQRDSFKMMVISEQFKDTSFRDTLVVDKVESTEEALREIYKRMRPGDPPTHETAKALFENLFFNPKRYDLSEVGRLKLNNKLGLDYPLTQRLLTKEDILNTVRVLYDLRQGIGQTDDIDHLGNRRVRSVGESVENQFRIGLVRMEKAITERLNIMDLSTCMPHDLINAKPVTAAIKEFFGSSQLSQFMDQTNPLSSITHKRRLSALGPGGLTRERAGFEVRDVHPSHYGRICPIETPEGPNIGLISSLSTFARVNDFGFIETPYSKVANGQVSQEVVYLSATQEDNHTIAQANAPLDENRKFIRDLVQARRDGDYVMVPPTEIDLMDVSPKQLVSVAAALIPFLENDDANRALMGSNMQRQAVPLLKAQAPLVGTGIEAQAARDSGAVVVARNPGEVISVDAGRVVVRAQAKNKEMLTVDIYNLIKYDRSNQNTCINQTPIVSLGQKIKAGDVIADGQATDRGELALGRNVLVAFMPWNGYNFEDAIIVSEKLVKEDVYTSIHIEEFEVESRDTRQGKEEITRDIPNVSEEALKNLDDSGIIRIGAKVKTGDILVGKVTPKGETLLSPEEKLLKAIFGEKAGDVRDTSLVVPPGNEGTVINVKVFSRRGSEKDARSVEIENSEREKLEKDMRSKTSIVEQERDSKIRDRVRGHKSVKTMKKGAKTLIATGAEFTAELLAEFKGPDLVAIEIDNEQVMQKVTEIIEESDEQANGIRGEYEDRIEKFAAGDELAPGVIKMVKVYIAIKRKLQVGDKMAGRHGNKGVVSVIVPEEDMPYMEDGTPIEIILNPLGVPSRMNVGQIMETNLGMAAHLTGEHMMTPVFDGAHEEDIRNLLEASGYPKNGKITLVDGKTGLKFDQQVLAGYIYMLKLHHLVDDKIHARSTGPYSLVTQQPLGGKAQFGGQRLGEMEVWALEAYGAAFTLQEMLTVKSDDVEGRKRIYESIVKGDHMLHPGVPESFNVLVKELQALGLDVELLQQPNGK
ncbi:MAG: DNA-directed RNA polymerase subunit beta [Nitrospinota bacterium]|nr:DNA-directed RNA polymerase subunit beta [Nitrospinota bacterium]MDH5756243.1 DNA-directed RNA polymerase subunit beta [Nitrospinota bacterium]